MDKTTIMMYNKFHITRFKELTNWSVSQQKEHDFGYSDSYPLVAISKFLVPNKVGIEIQDDVEYKQITVKTKGGGVGLRCLKKGKDIGTKQQWLARSGQFVLSKIDARNGAMGIVPEELDESIVTHDFPLFDVKTDVVNPQFLLLIITTESFMKFAQSCSSGTTNRQRINVKKFLQQRIPLPSLEEQYQLIKNYQEIIVSAETLENSSITIDISLLSYFDNILGSQSIKSPKIHKGLNFFMYSNIDKWGVDFISQKEHKTSLYKFAKLKSLCSIGSGGTPSRSIKRFFNGNIPWLKTCELNNDIIYHTEECLTTDGLDSCSAKLYEPNSIIIAMYGATIGRTALLGISCSTNQACAVLHDISIELVSTYYLWYYLQYHRYEFKNKAYGSAQPNINAKIIAEYEIPLPPLSVQQEIVDYVTSERAKAKALKEEAIQLRKQAKVEFEKQIFAKL